MIRPLSAMAAAFILPLALLFAPNAHAQGKPLACQFQEAGGLSWKQGQWNVARFKLKEPFILVLKGDNLDPASVAKPLDDENPVCEKTSSISLDIRCHDQYGGSLFFSPKTNRGAVSQLNGGTSAAANTRDSLSVSPFICQPY